MPEGSENHGGITAGEGFVRLDLDADVAGEGVQHAQMRGARCSRHRDSTVEPIGTTTRSRAAMGRASRAFGQVVDGSAGEPVALTDRPAPIGAAQETVHCLGASTGLL